MPDNELTLTGPPYQRKQQMLRPAQDPLALSKKVRAGFRATFSSPEGRRTLAGLLNYGKVFGLLTNEADMAEHNYAVDILRNLGVVEYDAGGAVSNMSQIVDSLLAVEKEQG